MEYEVRPEKRSDKIDEERNRAHVGVGSSGLTTIEPTSEVFPLRVQTPFHFQAKLLEKLSESATDSLTSLESSCEELL